MTNKNIVFCSDGTGQAGGQGFVSNVWRVFKAIDRHNAKEQVAFHVDGVGTEKNKYMRAVGGVFGWGLSKDICLLYAALVRSYNPGDQIFLFGFSRGAFTMRSLAGMIHDIGILKGHESGAGFTSDAEIDEAVKAAYKAYRSKNLSKKKEELEAKYEIPNDRDIEFVGVWDTIDAIGVPFDELRTVIYKLAAFSRRAHRAELNPSIKNAYHAMSIDDERQTFRPMVWNEEHFGGTVEQVWFAGVHTNVGGGYPKDSLAYLPLDWIMKYANECGLKFDSAKWKPLSKTTASSGQGGEYQALADRNGRIYDSRGGAAVYYRFKPRMIGDLCPEDQTPNIHESALLRIQSGYTGYAPAAVPADFNSVPTWSSDIEKIGTTPGAPDGLNMEKARDWICWRRLLYFGFLLWSFLFIGAGIVLDKIGGNPCGGDWLCTGIARTIETAKGLLPDFTYGWLDSYASHPYVFGIMIVVLIVMSKLKMWLMKKTDIAANEAWKKITITLKTDATKGEAPEDTVT